MALVAFSSGVAEAKWKPFEAPSPVTIGGYEGSAEEPFISPDGRYLLFNSSEEEPDFSLRFAREVSATTFEYQGELTGSEVNVAGSLSGTPSLDQQGELFFISNRSYFDTLATVYTGNFDEGNVSGVHLAPGVVSPGLGTVDFDVGVSPDGSTLYVSEGQFGPSGGPSAAKIVMFERDGEGFIPYPAGEKIMRAVNKTGALNYAADLSENELELFFTAASPASGIEPSVYVAKRKSIERPFGRAKAVSAITGFAEAPSLSADGTTLYYHEATAGKVAIYAVKRELAGGHPKQADR